PMTLTGNAWAITVYQNPFACPLRIANYRCFRRNLGLPLLTIEHSQSDNYDLADDDADVLLRTGSSDILWQKERLLNVAHSKLPESVSIVVWVDSDIVFTNRTWYDQLQSKLRETPVVQCYSELVDLPEGADLNAALGR